MYTTTLISGFLSWVVLGARGYTSYDNDFIDPDVILAKKWNSSASAAEQTVVQWADELAGLGPWSVMDKGAVAPSNDKHDYLSWAPYSWPNCSNVHNTTKLKPEQVWVRCNYEDRDGVVNPDRLLVNDTVGFSALGDAVLYNSIAWVVTNKSSKYSKTAASFISTWFLDDATKMNPNLNYGQLRRGPDGQKGSPYGLLDLHAMSKIVTAVEILRKGKSPDWTSEKDAAMTSWAVTYTTWLQTSPIAKTIVDTAKNNHVTYYYNQLASLKVLAGDLPGAVTATDTYFNKNFKGQVDAKGDQPLEATRTRPFHYRAYNLVAMTTNARIAQYAGAKTNPWKIVAAGSATLQTAVDFMMTLNPSSDIAVDLDPKTEVEVQGQDQISLPIAQTVHALGDPGAKYATFLKKIEPDFAAQPWFLWTQPLWDGESEDDTEPETGSSGSGGSSGSSSGTSTRASSAGGSSTTGVGSTGTFTSSFSSSTGPEGSTTSTNTGSSGAGTFLDATSPQATTSSGNSSGRIHPSWVGATLLALASFVLL